MLVRRYSVLLASARVYGILTEELIQRQGDEHYRRDI